MVFIQKKFKLAGGAALVALALAGCGGGSSDGVVVEGGGVVDGGSSSSGGSTTQLTALNLTSQDTLLSTTAFIGDGSGGWGGGGDGGSDGGGGDGAGAAGDGEFVRFKVSFPNATSTTGTLTWTVLVSQYGIKDSTGTLTITRDFSSTGGIGGYRVVNPRPGQANFLLSVSGQISGTLPLPIGAGGAVKDVIFNGIRFNDATLTLAEIAGTYGYGALTTDPRTGVFSEAVVGVFKLNTDGSGRICYDTPVWSASCIDGIDVVAKFDATTPKESVLQITNAAAQSRPITTNNPTEISVTAVLRKFGVSGISMSGDLVGKDTRVVNDVFTGAMYASKLQATPTAPSAPIGAWNYTGTNYIGTGEKNLRVAIANTAGGVKTRVNDGTNCDPVSMSLSPLTDLNGGLLLTNPQSPTIPNFVILLDVDSAVVVTPEQNNNSSSIGLARRYSTDPTKATGTGQASCQPV